jgi:hypothetical protein
VQRAKLLVLLMLQQNSGLAMLFRKNFDPFINLLS